MHDIENEVEAKDDDFDFELEITNLSPDGKIDHLLVRLATLRTQLAPAIRARLLFKQSPNVTQDGATDDDFELEIIDLPESEKPELSGIAAPLATWASRLSPSIRRKRTLPLAMIGIIVALIVLVVLGGIPSTWNRALSLFAHPTPTPAITSGSSLSTEEPAITGSGRIIGRSGVKIFIWNSNNGTPQVLPVQDNLGPAPQNCPQNTTQGFDSPPFPAAAGGTPLLITGFNGSGTTLNHLKRAKHPELGWYQQITLQLASNYPNVVVLQGADMNLNAPLLFDTIPSDLGLTALLMLDPGDSSLSNHTAGDQQWISFTTNVYVPAAGCYYLSANWADGSWMIYFAAGK
ncbi:MAG TPA: hypothetical protein VF043_12265 [Ktedonobacteraceae bacterium]